MLIRTFRNGDLPKLLDLWEQHWSMLGPPPVLSMAKFEQAIFARTFFRPERFLVATDDKGELMGWAHTDASPCAEHHWVVCAICFLPADIEVAAGLLDAAVTLAQSEGRTEISVGVVRDQMHGFAGLDPVGHGIGVAEHDQATSKLLQSSGFEPNTSSVQLIASTTEYRPPISRETMQFRRSTRTTTQTHVFEDRRHASAMSHFDVETTALVNAQGDDLASLRVWYSDPEAEVMDPGMSIFDLTEAQERGRLTSEEVYLVGTTLQSMERRRVMSAETVVSADRTDLIAQLESLRFQACGRGAVWSRHL